MQKQLLDIFNTLAILNAESKNTINLSDKDMGSLKKNLKIYIDGGDDDSDSSVAELSFTEKDFLSLGKSARAVVLIINEYYNCNDQVKKHKLFNVIAQIKQSLEKIKKEFDSINNTIINKKPITSPSEHDYEIQTKLVQYGLFALNRAINSNFFPTNSVKINTDDLLNLSRTELISFFDKDVFYTLNRDQILKLMQAVSNEFLSSKGVPSCAVELTNLRLDENKITYGQYNPNTGTIYFNKNILDLIDQAKESKNQFLPYQIVSTIIHEAEHRYQFYCLNKDNKSNKEECVCRSLFTPLSGSFSQYLACPDELDARNTSLEYFRTLANETGNEHLAQFYNETKLDEMRNRKNTVPSHIETFFPEIYNGSLMLTSQPSSLIKRNYYKLIRSHLESGKIL